MTGETAPGSAPAPVYEINDGVRRSKAAMLAGKQRIPANVGASSSVQQIPLDLIRSSPIKPVIDITSPREEARWRDILSGVIGGKPIRPIHVRKMASSRGLPIRDVRVVKNGKPVDPFTGV
jgi:hypothetical protein